MHDELESVKMTGSLMQQEARLIATRDRLDPELVGLSEKVAALQDRAALFCKKLRPYGISPSSSLSDLLGLHLVHLFEPESGDALPLPPRISSWESEIRSFF